MAFCTVCGWKYDGSPSFCQQCGTPLAGGAAAAANAAPNAAPTVPMNMPAPVPMAATGGFDPPGQPWMSEEHDLWQGKTMDLATRGELPPNRYRLTTRSIYVAHGRIGSKESSIPLWAIGSVTLEQDLMDKMRNVGNLFLEIEHPDWTDDVRQLKLELIEDPTGVRDLILKQIREEQYNYERRKQTMFYQGRPPMPPR
jgi:hypothetical protein